MAKLYGSVPESEFWGYLHGAGKKGWAVSGLFDQFTDTANLRFRPTEARGAPTIAQVTASLACLAATGENVTVAPATVGVESPDSIDGVAKAEVPIVLLAGTRDALGRVVADLFDIRVSEDANA